MICQKLESACYQLYGVLSKGTIKAADLVGPLQGMSLDDLLEAMSPGKNYVNFPTDLNHGGEIQSPIEPRNP